MVSIFIGILMPAIVGPMKKEKACPENWECEWRGKNETVARWLIFLALADCFERWLIFLVPGDYLYCWLIFLALANGPFLSTFLSPGSAWRGNVAIGVSNIHMHTSLFLTHQYLHGNHGLFKKLIVVVFNNSVWSTKHCLDLMWRRFEWETASKTWLWLYLGKKNSMFYIWTTKQKEKFNENKKSAPPIFVHSILCFGGIQYSTTYFLS